MIKFENMPTLYTLEEAAELIKFSVHGVRKYVKEGKLDGRMIGKKWYVTEDSLKALAFGDNIAPSVVSSDKEPPKG